MKYRTIPNTELAVSETGFGTWTLVSNWWGNVSEEDSIKLVHKALDLGINLFDTADQYRSGENEEVVAKALQGLRNEVVLCTKFGYDFYTFQSRIRHQEKPQKFEPDFIRMACEKSLQRLNTEWIDIYQFHNPRIDVIERDDVFEALEKLKQEGKIRYYGVALGPDIGWFEEGEASMRERKVTSIQIIYSILEQDPARAFFPIAKECGTGLFVRVPHASGLLDGTVTRDTVFPESDHRSYRKKEWLEESCQKVDQIDFLTRDKDITIGQAALKFSLAQETVSSVLLTVTDPVQLEEFALAPDLPDLSQEELDRVYDLYDHNFHVTPIPSES
ncbi:MAG: aldo/keto reductase [Chloroflexi bacterium]|nr:aldo/keto reductase [Chloroflexota bacterium]